MSKILIQKIQESLSLLILGQTIAIKRDQEMLNIASLEYLDCQQDATETKSWQIVLTNHRLNYLRKNQDNISWQTKEKLNEAESDTIYYLCSLVVEGKKDWIKSDYIALMRFLAGLENEKETRYSDHLILLTIDQLDNGLQYIMENIVYLGDLLPAFLIKNEFNCDKHLAYDDLAQYNDIIKLKNISFAPLLLNSEKGKINAEITIFSHGLKEHYAIKIPPFHQEQEDHSLSSYPLVRVHSSCFTGDLLQSLRCDCYPQLHKAIQDIACHSAGGILVYLQQEGRDIGLKNKIRTYFLQQKLNLDTLDANHYLGLKDDARSFAVAADILKYFNLKQISLLSNNPAKAKKLNKYGIDVMEMIEHKVPITEDLQKYYQAKMQKFDHINLY